MESVSQGGVFMNSRIINDQYVKGQAKSRDYDLIEEDKDTHICSLDTRMHDLYADSMQLHDDIRWTYA